MKELFVSLLGMSLASSLLITAAVLARLFRLPKRARCVLWACAALRLMIPVSFESVLSLVPPKAVSGEIHEVLLTYYEPSGAIYVDTLPTSEHISEPVPVSSGAAEGFDILGIVSAVWLAGILAMIIYMTVCCIRVKFMVRESVRLKDNVYICDNIPGAFVFGLFRPKIYINSEAGEEKRYVLDHEKAHIKRLDHIWKPLGFLLLSVYWFNPICWLGYVFFCKDIELACDEKAIKNYDEKNRILYSKALLKANLAGGQYPLSFGGSEIKERVKNVLNYKKPAIWTVAVSAVICGAAAVCFMTNPVSSEKLDETGGAVVGATSLAASEITSDNTEDAAESTTAADPIETTETDTEPVLKNEGLLTPEEFENLDLDESEKARFGYFADAEGNIKGYVPPVIIDGKISLTIDEAETGIELQKPRGNEYAGYIWDEKGNVLEYIPAGYVKTKDISQDTVTPSDIDIISEMLSEARSAFLEKTATPGWYMSEGGLEFYMSSTWVNVLVPMEIGSAAYALEGGTVISAEWDKGKGLAVCVENPNGERTHYAHLSETAVEAGDTVVKGQVVGYAGTTGMITGSGIGYNKNYTDNTEN